jgi:class 3 adenylate cyclase
MIGLLEAKGGVVVQFSGDALTAVFVCDSLAIGGTPSASTAIQLPPAAVAQNVQYAWTAATAMQQAMSEFAALPTTLGNVGLEMKITISSGEIIGLTVGGVNEHWQYLIAGEPLDQVARVAEDMERGAITFSLEAEKRLHEATSGGGDKSIFGEQ